MNESGTQTDNLSLGYLRCILFYIPESGTFFWRENRGQARRYQVAGSRNGRGYIQISIESRSYLAHRLAWFYVTGNWPKHGLDHINGDTADNRWENLREATQFQNQANRKCSKRNSSGYKGVTKKRNKWIAQITTNGRSIYLGSFATKQEAYEAYCMAARKYHGEFARFA